MVRLAHSFEAALGVWERVLLYTGNDFPIVAGAFGKVNEDASKLITKLARLTAKTNFGKLTSPLVSHSRAGKGAPSHNHAVPVQVQARPA